MESLEYPVHQGYPESLADLENQGRRDHLDLLDLRGARACLVRPDSLASLENGVYLDFQGCQA